jgi:PEP-CTERM motif
VKKYIALLASLIASSAIGQIITYEVRGKVSVYSGAPGFTVGDSYTLDFSIDKSNLFAPDLDTFATFPALSVKFNYANGAYVGTMDSALAWAINYSTGDYFYVGTPFSGKIDFPTVQGGSLLSTIPSTSNYGFSMLTLYDPTGNALSANSFFDLSKIDQFVGSTDERMNLVWASDPAGEFSTFYGTVDSIEKVNAPLSPVPEPSTYGLVGSAALFGLIVRRLKRRRIAEVA